MSDIYLVTDLQQSANTAPHFYFETEAKAEAYIDGLVGPDKDQSRPALKAALESEIEEQLSAEVRAKIAADDPNEAPIPARAEARIMAMTPLEYRRRLDEYRKWPGGRQNFAIIKVAKG